MIKILGQLVALYGDDIGRAAFARLQLLISNYRALVPVRQSTTLTERDAILITYGDQVRTPHELPLQTLANFCVTHLRGVVSGIHILPFFPYSSDDGFSVIDYHAVNPALGTWDDVTRVGEHFRLMFDAVVNHISAQSVWFQSFLRGDPRYRDYFIVVPDGADVSRVIRPRTWPLFTRYDTPSGAKNIWTTFSADQIDLNFRNSDVLLEIIDTLLFYVVRGAEFIRLDAIAFLWKEFGTTCLHLSQTHQIIQLFRAVLDEIAPPVLLITETNVPHADNLAYFGDGTNEAQMVYNFALPPLILHTFHTADARAMARWASGLTLPSDRVTFFNFLASHDGIGLNPARGILGDEEINTLVKRTKQQSGLVSYKSNPDGTSSPYELNINYFDALSDPYAHESLDVQMDRFVCAHAVMLAFIGVPGIYFHSIFGSRSCHAGVGQTGHYRAINREKLSRDTLEHELSDSGSLRYQVLARLRRLLQVRRAHPAFDPYAPMHVIEGNPSVLIFLRGKTNNQPILCLHNVSGKPQQVKLDRLDIFGDAAKLFDLITDHLLDRSEEIILSPFQVLWLKQIERA